MGLLGGENHVSGAYNPKNVGGGLKGQNTKHAPNMYFKALFYYLYHEEHKIVMII